VFRSYWTPLSTSRAIRLSARPKMPFRLFTLQGWMTCWLEIFGSAKCRAMAHN